MLLLDISPKGVSTFASPLQSQRLARTHQRYLLSVARSIYPLWVFIHSCRYNDTGIYIHKSRQSRIPKGGLSYKGGCCAILFRAETLYANGSRLLRIKSGVWMRQVGKWNKNILALKEHWEWKENWTMKSHIKLNWKNGNDLCIWFMYLENL